MRSAEIGPGHSAVVFDLWGTLIPFPSSAWDPVLAEIAAALGASLADFLPAWHADYARRAVGDVAASLWRVCELAGVTADERRVHRALEIRHAALASMFVPRPDAATTLRCLRERGYRVGLLTNCTSEVPRLWQRSPLSALMDATVFSCAEGIRKPDAVAYELAATRLGVPSSRCVFVGDGADSELDGATAADMHAFLLRAPDTDPPRWDGPDIQQLGDVLALLPGPAASP